MKSDRIFRRQLQIVLALHANTDYAVAEQHRELSEQGSQQEFDAEFLASINPTSTAVWADRKIGVAHQVIQSIALTRKLIFHMSTLMLLGLGVRRTMIDADQPPHAAKFLLLLVPLRNREGIIGDLEEEYRTILVPEYGHPLAKFYYWWHVILTCVSSIAGAIGGLYRLVSRG